MVQVLTARSRAPLCCPLRLWQGEHFILRRPGMEFQAKDSFGRKFKGKVCSTAAPAPVVPVLSDARVNLQGELHVSTIRMVFVNNSGGDMQAFDLPMANITNEKFNQPIFGANNISGTVAAVRAAHSASRPVAVLSPAVELNPQLTCVAPLTLADRQRAGRCHRTAGVQTLV